MLFATMLITSSADSRVAAGWIWLALFRTNRSSYKTF